MNHSESAKQWKIGKWTLQIAIESSCQSVKPNNIYFSLNYFCSCFANFSQSHRPHGWWKVRLYNLSPHVGSVGVLSDAGAVSGPANASICFQSSSRHLKSLCFIAPCSVSSLSHAIDARNSVKISPLEVLSYTELKELQCCPCMIWQNATHHMHQQLFCFPSTISFSGKKKSLKNAKNFEK